MPSRPRPRQGTCEISSISCASINKQKPIGSMCHSIDPCQRKEVAQVIQNPTPPNNPRYDEQRLAGLRAYAARQRQTTLERLHAAITALKDKGEPITVHTIRETSGLDYKSIARNPEALALFRHHSTFLATKRKETKKKRKPGRAEEIPQPKDPLLNYKRPQLAARLRQEMQRREEIEIHYRQLLEERVQSDLKMVQLEADLARYHDFLGHLRAQVQQEEQQGETM